MREYVLALLAAAAVTYLLTPLVRRFATAVGAEHAARDRDVHVVPTPLLGGFAMYAGLAAALLVASRLPQLNSVFQQTNLAKGLLLAGALVVVMGFVDDRWGMSALSKLTGQVAAGVILVWSGGEVTWLPEPGGGTLSLTSDQQTAITILVVVMTINAVNFIDGLDGLAAGVVAIGAAAFFLYYYTISRRLGLDQTGPALVSALLAGVCLGFLPHNFHPARIFMGDTGSMLIGLLLAAAPITSLASLDPGSLTNRVNRFADILPLLLPAAILLIPYADLLMAVVRRTRAGTSMFAPDKKHLHHRLLDIGHSHRTSVLIMYLWTALFAGSVVWLSIVRTPLIVLAIVTVGAMLVLLLVSMPRLRPWGKPAAGEAGATVSLGRAGLLRVPRRSPGRPAARRATRSPSASARPPARPRPASAPPFGPAPPPPPPSGNGLEAGLPPGVARRPGSPPWNGQPAEPAPAGWAAGPPVDPARLRWADQPGERPAADWAGPAEEAARARWADRAGEPARPRWAGPAEEPSAPGVDATSPIPVPPWPPASP